MQGLASLSLGDLDARDHPCGDQERRRVEVERERERRRRHHAVERHGVLEVPPDDPQAAEQRRGERDRAIGRREHQPVREGERPLRRELRDARVARRQEQQRDALVDERDRVHGADPEVGDQQDQAAPHQVARHHQHPAVELVGEQASHRCGEDRRDQPDHQDHGDLCGVVGQRGGQRDQCERRHPVAHTGHGLADQQAPEPGRPEQPGRV